MLSTRNKIILVDDNKDHLNSLSDALFNQKISCLPIVYDVMYDDPMSGIRLAFFDINLLNSSNESQILATILETLPKYISNDNGPFALIFWTDKKDLIPKIKLHINERGGANFPRPFIVDCIDKDEFYGEDKAEDLINKLNEIFQEPTLNIMVDYENVVNDSVINTINQFFEIIPSNDNWGENTNYIDNFEKVFSRIASSALGFKHAQKNPDKAVYYALTGTLKYYIEHHDNKGYWGNTLNSLKNANKLNDIGIVNNFNYSRLNNLLHITPNISQLEKDERGVVISLKKVFLRKFQFDFTKFYSSMIKFSYKASKEAEALKEIKKIINNSQLICIEISASCDYSQKSSRINNYILGFITPKLDSKILTLSNGLPAKSYHLINYMEDKVEKVIWLNLNYVIGCNPKDPNLGDIKFKLKSELVNQIGNRYANHISRIGITSF